MHAGSQTRVCATEIFVGKRYYVDGGAIDMGGETVALGSALVRFTRE